MIRAVALIAWVAVVSWTGPAWAGWVIDQVARGTEGRQQVMVQANRMKTLLLAPDGKPEAAVILDLNAETITQVDYAQRQYVTGTVQEYVETMQGAMGGMAAAMQEQLRNVPPAQRKMVEEMMRSQMGQAGAGAECRVPRVEVRRAGEQATIAGYPAVRYEVLADGKPESDVWIAAGITAWRELDRAKLERFGTEMAKLSRCGPARSGAPLGPADGSWKLAGEGYPVRTVDRGGGGTVEVVKAESRTLPPAEFQPPAGFAQKRLQDLMMGR